MTTPIRSTIIHIKLCEMTESIELVQNNLPESADGFCRLGLIKDGIYKRVEYAIENVFDICAILNSDLHLGIPGTDEDLPEQLMEYGMFGSEMREKIKAMKGFRTIVVHRYGKIDDTLTFMILQEHMEDFAQFRQAIEEFLASSETITDC